MFIMPARKRQGDKTYTYYNLVTTIRTPKGPRHRVILSLGSLPGLSAEQIKLLGRLITQKLGGTLRLLPEASAELEGRAERIATLVAEKRGRQGQQGEQIRVDPETIRLSEALVMGPVYVGLEVWRKLGLPEILSGCGFSQRRRHLACAEVIARLVAPGSELATSAWVPRTALGLLLRERLSYVNKDALYRVSDRLWSQRERIEAALAGRERQLFELAECYILYDLSSTYFEGQCPYNHKAKRGYSRDHRPDCKQVVVGMVLDEAGFPKATEIYEGNTPDKRTLQSMLEGLQRRVGKRDSAPTVVMDRGVATEENLKRLKESGYHYLVGCPGEQRDEWIGVIQANAFRHVEAASKDHPGVEVSLQVRGQERYLFVRSPVRIQKDKAIRERFVARMQEGLKRLGRQVEQGRIKDPPKIQRRIGKLQERHKRAARFFSIQLEQKGSSTELRWAMDDQKLQQAELLDGCYTLKTDREDIGEESFWSLFTMLNRVERSFRYLKSSLGIRPNFHQLGKRVEGHIFISILAYHLLHAIEQMLLAHGDHRSWPTIKGELDTHRVMTLRLSDSESRVHHRQTATTPTDAQREIYQKLRLPERPLPNRRYVLEPAV